MKTHSQGLIPNARRTVSAAVALASMVTLVAGSTPAGASSRVKVQKVEGAVKISTPQPLEEGACLSGVQRRASAVAGDAANGAIGWTFDVDPATWNGPFSLELTGGSSDANLNITFYQSVSSDDPTVVPRNFSYQATGAGGEKGIVPRKMTAAIVCLYAGSDATFRYSARPPTVR